VVNGSWILALHHVEVTAALKYEGEHIEVVKRAVKRICESQRVDGSWGRCEETAYAVNALHNFRDKSFHSNEVQEALAKGRAYLRRNIRDEKKAHVWICKESFTPTKISRAFVLAALLSETSATT
jgi:hypothetical protein